MAALLDQKLQACTSTSPALSNQEISQLLSQLDGWELEVTDGVSRIKKAYIFDNFSSALEYTNKIGLLAEAENHHPGIYIEWGKVTLSWWTHIVSGLFINDFIMAAKCDATYKDKLG